MKNNLLIIGVVILLVIVAYLLAAHHSIYKRIADAGLKASDVKGEYIIGNGTENGSKLKYTALGDSLTAGVGVAKYEESYPYLIAQKISGGTNAVDLHDRSYPGARTDDLINNFLTAAVNDQPDIVTLLIGVNDIHGNVSKTQFSENYAKILKRLKTETKARVFAVSIPYIGTDSLLLPPFNLYFKRETVEFNKIIKQLARDYNATYVDLYTPTEQNSNQADFYAADSFHPSAKGYALWAEIIYADYHQ
jgi:lysophospholipase L1-like esterase